eukprot:m.303905 g.303905  ORF g.303905 m.303905 type:complete len:68 (+) comp15894_c0_seq16:1523-1726(+)
MWHCLAHMGAKGVTQTTNHHRPMYIDDITSNLQTHFGFGPTWYFPITPVLNPAADSSTGNDVMSLLD